MNQIYTQPGTPQIHWVYLTFKITEHVPLDRNNTVVPLDQDHTPVVRPPTIRQVETKYTSEPVII